LHIGDPEGIRIRYLRFLHQLITTPSDRIGLLVHDFVVSEFHIVSRKLLSIVPENALSEVKSDLGLRTSLYLPRLCQFSHEALKIPVIFNQSVEDKAVNIAGGRILGEDGVEKRGIADGTDDQLIHLLRRSGPDEEDVNPQEDEKEDREDGQESLDLQRKALSMRAFMKL
jgi:hypothetical protein